MKTTDKRNELITWNKLHPDEPRFYKTRKLADIKSIAIHHSLTFQGSSEAFARYHVTHNGWPGIGYHFVIDKNGNIDICNDLTTKSAHVGISNKEAIGVCLIGDFRTEQPTEDQLQSAADLCFKLIDEIETIREIKGHSDYPGYSWKKCPAFDVMRITNRIKAFDI